MSNIGVGYEGVCRLNLFCSVYVEGNGFIFKV